MDVELPVETIAVISIETGRKAPLLLAVRADAAHVSLNLRPADQPEDSGVSLFFEGPEASTLEEAIAKARARHAEIARGVDEAALDVLTKALGW